MKTVHIMPKEVGIIHLIGIGGIGISGIAEILHNLGYQVQGSDMAENANVERLRAMGIDVAIGHRAENVEKAAVVVKSSAVRESNPEIQAARTAHIPVLKRSEMLAEIVRMKATVAIAGTHGKTTTTSMVAQMFEAAGKEPTVINGGIINTRGTNAYIGAGEWLVVEADESDGTFIRLPSTVGVVTNIDPEHLEYYGSYGALKEAFKTFIENLPFYGFGVMCKDHPVVKEILADINDRKVITYGLEEHTNGVDVFGTNIRQDAKGSTFDVVLSERITGDKERVIKNVFLPMPGMHNVSNALAAISVASELKFGDEAVIEGFKHFGGVKRRFTKTGEVGGVTIIDDYGHHPTEIKASLKTARGVVERVGGKVVAVVQPHRYSRVRDLFKEFATCCEDADIVLVSEIYAAGEDPIEGISQATLIAAMKKQGKEVYPMESPETLAAQIQQLTQKDDLVICLGAGTVTKWANDLPAQLAALAKEEDKQHAGTTV